MWQNDVLRSDVLIVGVRWLPGWRGPRSNIGNCNYPALKRSPCLWFSYGAPSTCWREEECEQLEPHQMKILIVCLLNTTTVTNDGRQSLAIVDMSEQCEGMSRLGNTINICQDWNPNKKLSQQPTQPLHTQLDIVEIVTLFYLRVSILISFIFLLKSWQLAGLLFANWRERWEMRDITINTNHSPVLLIGSQLRFVLSSQIFLWNDFTPCSPYRDHLSENIGKISSPPPH